MKIMSRFLVLATGLLFFYGTVQAAVTVTKKGNKTIYHFSIDEVEMNKVQMAGKSFLKPELKGVDGYTGVSGELGAPELPTISFYVDGQSSIRTVDIKLDVSKKLKAGLQIAPRQASLEKVVGVKKAFSYSAKAYASQKMSHSNLSVTDAGSIRFVRRQLVTLAPLAYNPVDGQYTLVREWTIETTLTELVASLDLPDHIAFVVGQDFENSAALADYMTFKQGQGFTVSKIVYGRDVNSVNDVRSALQDLLRGSEVNLRHAIIVGDSSDVPAKSAGHMSGPTDHYYRAIDTDNYESDLNGPDIRVGRFSVGNETDLRNVVDKYIRYQTGEFSNQAWLGQMAFMATSDGGYYRVAEGTHNYVIDTYTNDLGYEGNFPEANQAGGDKIYAITYNAGGSEVMAALREGRVFVTYSGHGYTGGWAAPALNSSNVLSLNETDFMPFVLGFACDTGDYRGNNGIAESWQRHPFGAILYWGSVDSSYWDEDDVLEKRIFDGIFERGLRQIGDVLDFGLSEHWRHYNGGGKSKYYWESYTTFADPSVMIHGVAK